ncbi:hypothetical protein, partial [Sporisorium scitamineum]
IDSDPNPLSSATVVVPAAVVDVFAAYAVVEEVDDERRRKNLNSSWSISRAVLSTKVCRSSMAEL